MPTVSESVCCQEIPEEEGKLRELDVQSTVSQIMRGSDQFAWTDGCCKQSHRKCTTSIAKTVKPMDLHTIIVLSSPYSHVDVWISFKSVVYIIPRHYVTGNWQDGAGNIWKEIQVMCCYLGYN